MLISPYCAPQVPFSIALETMVDSPRGSLSCTLDPLFFWVYRPNRRGIRREPTQLRWESVEIPATQEEEGTTLRFAFQCIGLPFDWRGMFGFLLIHSLNRESSLVNSLSDIARPEAFRERGVTRKRR
jgi:hypothetical protein